MKINSEFHIHVAHHKYGHASNYPLFVNINDKQDLNHDTTLGGTTLLSNYDQYGFHLSIENIKEHSVCLLSS